MVKINLLIPTQKEVFTHIDNSGKARTFLTGDMYDYALRVGNKDPNIVFNWLDIDQDLAAYLRSNHGIEQHRVDRLVDPWLSRPVVGIFWPDNEVTIVDGNHRIVKSVEAGILYPKWKKWLDDLESRVMAIFPWGWGQDVPRWYTSMKKHGQQDLFMPMCIGCEREQNNG